MAVRDKKKQTETGFITAGDRYLFGEGTHYEIYNKLGAHPKTFDGKDGYYFAVWAPHAASVSVVGDFNNWDPDACPMQVLETSGIYERFIPGIKPGELYNLPSLPRPARSFLRLTRLPSTPNTGLARHPLLPSTTRSAGRMAPGYRNVKTPTRAKRP